MPNIKPFLPARPSGIVFISLNILRALSIIALVLVFSSNIVTMVKDIKAIRATPDASEYGYDQDDWDCEYYEYSTVPDQTGGPFWSVLNRLFILFECILLILSEIGIPRNIFETYIPILGPAHGLGCLGVFQSLIAASVLSHYSDLFPQVSAWLLFIIGCFNIIAGLVWRQKAKAKRLIFSWENVSSLTPQTRMAHTAWEMVTEKRPSTQHTHTSGTTGNNNHPDASQSKFHTIPLDRSTSAHTNHSEAPLLPGGVGQSLSERFAGVRAGVRSSFNGMGFGRSAEDRTGVKISKPLETLPRYAT